MGRTHDVTISGFDLQDMEAELHNLRTENAKLDEDRILLDNAELDADTKAILDTVTDGMPLREWLRAREESE